jgi:CheY-like chemotaxis protein
MSVFISHSFENKPEFENIVDALDSKSVPYWNPSAIKPGASLREQLKAAVEHCNICIFIATRHSIQSSWCGAELGAFWGAGKPIIVYLAEASLPESELPPVVQGDVWERRISKIVDRAKEVVNQIRDQTSTNLSSQASSIAQLTVEQLQKLIAGAVALAAATSKAQEPSQNFEAMESAVTGAASKVLAGFQAAESFYKNSSANDWHNKILWVDDSPENNIHERQAMESMGLEFSLALSTSEALKTIEEKKFAAIISDMARKEGSREGYALLEALREKGNATPFFIYAGSNARTLLQQQEAASRGAQGSTNIANELVEMVVRALPTRPA